jgi:hypothetical protein
VEVSGLSPPEGGGNGAKGGSKDEVSPGGPQKPQFYTNEIHSPRFCKDLRGVESSRMGVGFPPSGEAARRPAPGPRPTRWTTPQGPGPTTSPTPRREAARRRARRAATDDIHCRRALLSSECECRFPRDNMLQARFSTTGASEEGGHHAVSWQPPVQLAKMEGSEWRRLELWDEVAGSDVGPVRRARKARGRDGMSAMPDDCIMKECSTGETSEGLLRALAG